MCNFWFLETRKLTLLSLFFVCVFCRLALYVYEYLLHVGAQKSAQTFLSEVRRHRTCNPTLILKMLKKIQIKSISVLAPLLLGEAQGIIMQLWVVVYKSV